MKQAIVSGANGFIGRHLVEELVDKGYFVYCLVRNGHDNYIKDYDNVSIINCDLNDIDSLDIDIDNGIFFHMAWEGSGGELRKDYNIQLNNVRNTINVAKVAKKIGCNRLVMAGSVTQLMYKDYMLEDYATPEMISIYPAAKVCAEMMLKCVCNDIGLDLNYTYIANFYGEDDTTNNFINFLINAYLDDKSPILTPANQLADFMHVKDVANALICIGEKGIPNKSYYVGYGDPKPLKYFITTIRDSINPLLDTGIGRKKLEGKSIDYNNIDYKALYNEMNFVPEIEFTEGIRKVIETIRKERKLVAPPQTTNNKRG